MLKAQKIPDYKVLLWASRLWHSTLSVTSVCAAKDKGSPGCIIEMVHAPCRYGRNEWQSLILVSTAHKKPETPTLFYLGQVEEVVREISNSTTLL